MFNSAQSVAIVALIEAVVLAMMLVYRAYHYRETRKRFIALQAATEEVEKLRRGAQVEAETTRREYLLDAQNEVLKIRKDLERESREAHADIQRLENRLYQKDEVLDRKLEQCDKRDRQLAETELELDRQKKDLDRSHQAAREELERVAQLSATEAQAILMRRVEVESRHQAGMLARRIEDEARIDADRKARKIVSLAVQRCAVDQAPETMISVVPLPSDDMKGRIIGREGRNIRAFENVTGVNLIVDDTPEAVVISGFDRVRRDIARIALEELVADGRIHPGRIEDVVARARLDVESRICDAGSHAVEEAGIVGLHPELLKMVGKLLYRASYGQNCLHHSLEVSHLAVLMASELGADVEVCRRAGLLHDIGKAADTDEEGPHHHISRNLALRYGESHAVAHAIEAHHDDIAPETVEAVLVQVADAISASRPGARRESLENYVRRLEKLESICDSFPGVEKSYVMQAGRELRVVVRPELVGDCVAEQLARDICKRIEDEVQHPGHIKVTVIRETRAVEYAK